MQDILKVIESLQSDKSLDSLDEASIKHAVILRILALLGWDTYNVNEVQPEFPVGDRKKVDFALACGNNEWVFIEAKRGGEDLDKHQEQLLNYSFRHGVEIAILTNGKIWWFFLPLRKGSWKKRRFYVVDLFKPDADDIARHFIDLLSKENIVSGKAVERAEEIYRTNQILESMPKAWNKLIGGYDRRIVSLITETTKELCGYEPSQQDVEKFIASQIKPIGKSPPKIVTVTPPTPNHTGQSITAFSFDGTRYEVESWAQLLVQVCEIISSEHKEPFNQVLNIRRKSGRPYFTRTPKELMAPNQIKETGIYVETNLIASMVIDLSKQVISLFGYDEGKLVFETQEELVKGPTAPSKNERYQAFFDRLRNTVLNIAPNFTRAKGLPQSHINFGIGRAGFHLYANFATQSKEFSIGIWINVGEKEDNDAAFSKLKAHQSKIESEIEKKLVWDSSPDYKTCSIYIPVNGSIDDDEQKLSELIEWAVPRLIKFREVFAPLVKNL